MPQGSTTTKLGIANGYLGSQVSTGSISTEVSAGNTAANQKVSMSQLQYTFAGTAQQQITDSITTNGFAWSYGWGLAINAPGNKIVVGAPYNGFYQGTNNGAVFTWTRSGTTWSEPAGAGNFLTPNWKGVSPYFFGYSISLSADGNTMAVGAPTQGIDATNSTSVAIGNTWIYTWSGSSWANQARIQPSNIITTNAQTGTSVALSADGNTVAIGGANDDTGVGATWIYTRSGSTWSQQAKLIGSGATGAATQGFSVAISADGNTVAIGGNTDNTSVGAVWVFTRSGTTWTQQGSKLIGSGYSGTPYMGTRVALSSNGNTLAFGGYGDNSNTGATWVFTRSGTTWTQQGSKLIGAGGVTAGVSQGFAVSLSGDGNVLAIGPNQDGTKPLTFWTFTRTNTTWTQTNAITPSVNGGGSSLAFAGTGNTLAVGCISFSGAAFAYV
jgi:hypothetical protein